MNGIKPIKTPHTKGIIFFSPRYPNNNINAFSITIVEIIA